ncbi:serine/threonine-protein kinase MRCK beta-like, partial [Myxocyprinus asiaticus]|uniref:serine/threonine-protein kinase MRCK beta-like n=1 Tax=Myxocyprinus asiaticus TaxID=70543 RepID=UPI0022227A2C
MEKNTPDAQTRGGDHSNVIDSKTKTIPHQEDTVLQMRNAMVPLEEAVKSTHQPPFASTDTYLKRCKQLEKENKEVTYKLTKMENYCRECKTELQTFVKRFKEFKTINNDLDLKNRQLLIKNQQMRQRITEVLKHDRPQSEDLKRITKCSEHHCQEKQQLKETIIQLQAQVKHLTEQVMDAHRIQAKTLQDSERIQEGVNQERKILTELQQENQTLRERLEHYFQTIKDAENRAEGAQNEQVELEHCLLAVQTERNLLRQEVMRLHKEYISLT